MASLMPKILQHSWRPNDNAPPCASLFELTSKRAPSVQHNCYGRTIRRSIPSLSCLSECLVIDSWQDRRGGECAKFGAFLALAICPQLRSLSLRESELELAVHSPPTYNYLPTVHAPPPPFARRASTHSTTRRPSEHPSNSQTRAQQATGPLRAMYTDTGCRNRP